MNNSSKLDRPPLTNPDFSQYPTKNIIKPTIIPPTDHPIKRANIDNYAVKVANILRKNGHIAYLVGGSVRDLLLDKKPKDFDMVTSASPNQIKKQFSNCRLIGRRFRLAHIIFGKDRIIEVATFRGAPLTDELDGKKEEGKNKNIGEKGSIDKDKTCDEDKIKAAQVNNFGLPQDDAFRRDITINALFYNFDDGTIIDYVGGLKDIRKRLIRCVGEAKIKFPEDPVRIIRALRHGARNDFAIEEKTSESIRKYAQLLGQCPKARILEELNKDLYSGKCEKILKLYQKYGLFPHILPHIAPAYIKSEKAWKYLEAIDEYVANSQENMISAIIWTLLIFPALDGLSLEKELKLAMDFGLELQLPRYNKEKMASLLRNRFRMMRWILSGRPESSLMKKSYFEETETFCELLIKVQGLPDLPPEKKKKRKVQAKYKKPIMQIK